MLVSLAATIALTGWSERTIWRKVADGTLAHEKRHGRALFAFDSLAPYLCFPLAPDDCARLAQADAGDAEAQHTVGLRFLTQGKPKGALFWLELAAKQNHADAMNLLGICFIEGHGVPTDETLGIAWIAKAATLGHAIAQRQMACLHGRAETLHSSAAQ